MNYFNYIKPKKTTKAEFKFKKLRKLNGNSYTDCFLELKSSSLDLTPYTDICNYDYMNGQFYFLFNKNIVTLIRLSAFEYGQGSDKIIGKLTYYKTFNRNDILNNLDAIKKNISLIEDKYVREEFSKYLNFDNTISELGFSTKYPLLTKEGWFSSVTNEFHNVPFMFESDFEKIIITKNTLLLSKFFISESRGKFLFIQEIETFKEIELNKNFFFNKPFDNCFISALSYDNIFLIKKNLKVKDKIVYESYLVDRTSVILEINNPNTKNSSFKYFEYEEKITNSSGIHYFINKTEVYFIPSSNKNILINDKLYSFDHDIKTVFNRENSELKRSSLVLLTNNELYLISHDENKNKPKLIASGINKLSSEHDINYEFVIFKSEDKIIYILDNYNESDYFIYNYVGNGIPFFYKLKKNKSYSKYEFIQPQFKLNGRGFRCLFTDISSINKFSLKNNHLSGPIDINLKTLDHIISAKLRRNTPYDFFIKKSNYLVFVSVDKTCFQIYLEEAGTYIHIFTADSYFSSFNSIKDSFKLKNLPLKILKSNESDFDIELIFTDYKILVSNEESRNIII